MSDIEFAKGIIVKAPRDNAPDFVKASISIAREDAIAWLQSLTGEWVNLDVKESRGGKWYAAVNTYKPKESNPVNDCPHPAKDDFEDSEIPF